MAKTGVKVNTLLAISASDSGGGAGLQADLKTSMALGWHCTHVVTGVTAQNTLGIAGVEAISDSFIQKQFETLLDDFCIRAVKIGAIASPATYGVLATLLQDTCFDSVPIVFDPVRKTSTGGSLLVGNSAGQDSQLLAQYQLLAQCTVVTPNWTELAQLSDHPPFTDKAVMMTCARQLAKKMRNGKGSVVVTGSDNPANSDLSNKQTVDCVISENQQLDTAHPTSSHDTNHGTGCTFSTALACGLGEGNALALAVQKAGEFVAQAIENGYRIGQGNGPVNPLALTNRACFD